MASDELGEFTGYRPPVMLRNTYQHRSWSAEACASRILLPTSIELDAQCVGRRGERVRRPKLFIGFKLEIAIGLGGGCFTGALILGRPSSMIRRLRPPPECCSIYSVAPG